MPGCFDSGLTALSDVLRTAEQLRATVDRSIDPIEVLTFGSATKVITGDGLSLAADHVVGDDSALAELDLFVVPGLGLATPPSRPQPSLRRRCASCAAGWRPPATRSRLRPHAPAPSCLRIRGSWITGPRRPPGG